MFKDLVKQIDTLVSINNKRNCGRQRGAAFSPLAVCGVMCEAAAAGGVIARSSIPVMRFPSPVLAMDYRTEVV
ncbi:hypothetical protein V5799_009441 [Amblyomma americanum]|uniref:Uncharacterized protein n=1 Tax=Amblyomma americanum TaxID=6943 RepID=A0AAQ4FAY0_AMBAM